MKTAIKSLLRKRQIKKCRRELRWVESTLARLEVERRALDIPPEVIRRLASLHEQAKRLRAALAQIDPLTEVIAS